MGDITVTTTAQLLFFTETDYNGDEFIVDLPSDNSVLVVKCPTNFEINVDLPRIFMQILYIGTYTLVMFLLLIIS